MKSEKILLHEIGFSEGDFNRLIFEFENTLKEQHQEYLDYITNEEESKIEKILKK